MLPIGGVKQKVLAAHRARLTDVVLSLRNGPDLEDVSGSVRNAIVFQLAKTVDDVLSAALEPTEASAGQWSCHPERPDAVAA